MFDDVQIFNNSKWQRFLPSVLWRCWLGGWKGIRPVKNLSGGVVAWLSVWSKMQTCTWPSWCHCHSLSLASVKSRLVLPFWYQLTWVVPEKGPLNGCVCVCVRDCCFFWLYFVCCSDLLFYRFTAVTPEPRLNSTAILFAATSSLMRKTLITTWCSISTSHLTSLRMRGSPEDALLFTVLWASIGAVRWQSRIQWFISSVAQSRPQYTCARSEVCCCRTKTSRTSW